MMHMHEVGKPLHRFHGFGRIQRAQSLFVDELAAIGMHSRRQRHPPGGRPVDRPLYDVFAVEAGIIGMTTIAVFGQLIADRQKLVPFPDFIVLEAGRRDASLVKELGVVIDVMGDPGRPDAIPAPIDFAAVRFLRLDEVILLSQQRVVFHQVGDILQDAASRQSSVIIRTDERGIGRCASRDISQGHPRVFTGAGRMLPNNLDIGVLGLEDLNGRLDALVFGHAAPAAKGHGGGILSEHRWQRAHPRQHRQRPRRRTGQLQKLSS